MEWIQFLRQLLLEAEAEHSRLGLPFEGWADWYAKYIAPKIPWPTSQSDRPADGITEGD